MKRIKQAMSLLLAAPLICAMLAGSAFAAQENGLWVRLAEHSGGVSAVVEANTSVTDGTIQLTFDPNKLTYVSCDFTGPQEEYKPYSAMQAVNDTKAGEGKLTIAWVAPGSQPVQGDTALFQVNFQAASGAVSADAVTMSGSANASNGQAVPVVQAPTAQPSQPPVQPSTAPSAQPSLPATAQPSGQPTTAPNQPNGGGAEQQPATGDSANVVLYLAVTVSCAAGLGLIITRKNQRRGVK